jgi:hypothetical protein
VPFRERARHVLNFIAKVGIITSVMRYGAGSNSNWDACHIENSLYRPQSEYADGNPIFSCEKRYFYFCCGAAHLDAAKK